MIAQTPSFGNQPRPYQTLRVSETFRPDPKGFRKPLGSLFCQALDQEQDQPQKAQEARTGQQAHQA